MNLLQCDKITSNFNSSLFNGVAGMAGAIYIKGVAVTKYKR